MIPDSGSDEREQTLTPQSQVECPTWSLSKACDSDAPKASTQPQVEHEPTRVIKTFILQLVAGRVPGHWQRALSTA
eukprot:9016-Rhodomonas_salina.1